MAKNKLILLITILNITILLVESAPSSGQTFENTDETNEGLLTRETNVEIKQNYLDCVNINSEVNKLTATFIGVTNESCQTIYRFPPFPIDYEVSFKNGSSSQMQIGLDKQDDDFYPGTIQIDSSLLLIGLPSDKTIVTLTGKVLDGYMKGAHFQNVIVYPALNSESEDCLTDSGITEMKSTSASITLILLPTLPEQSDSNLFRVLHLPEAFDCFGDISIKYSPALLNLLKSR